MSKIGVHRVIVKSLARVYVERKFSDDLIRNGANSESLGRPLNALRYPQHDS